MIEGGTIKNQIESIKKMDLKDTLLAAGRQFIASKAGESTLVQLIKKSGVKEEDIQDVIKDPRKVKEIIDENTPVISTFETKGRLYNKSTNEPEVGVVVKPQLALFPMVLETKTRKVKIEDPNGEKDNKTGKIKRITIEETYKEYVYDGSNTPEIKTDDKGEWNLRFGVPTLPSANNAVLVKPIVLYEKNSLAPDYQTLVTQELEVLQELPIKAMINIEDAANEAAIKLKEEANRAAEKASKIALSAVEQALLAVKSRVLKFASVIQNKLFPLAIGLFIIFGITKMAAKNVRAEVAEGRCPSDALLKMAIKRRNSIVRQINQIWIVIAANTAIAAVFLYLTYQLKTGKVSISSLAFPVAVPPGVGVPQSLLALLEDIKEKFEILANISKELRKALLISLVFLLISLIIILRYLKKIDALIEKCSIEGDIGMEEIESELLDLQNSTTEDDGAPVVKVVNGFTMNVVQDPKSKVGDLYRRYATASNSQGIVILKGESSFSATDQILIDELAFYIVQNNLKAD